MLLSPFEQFLINPVYMLNGYYVIGDNLLYMTIWLFIYFLAGMFCIYCTDSPFNFFRKYFHTFYFMFHRILRGYLPESQYQTYFPFLFYVFVFLFICNIISLTPHSFTLTSHFFVSLSLSASIWFSILFLGVSNWGITYLRLYFPKGINTLLMFLLVLIETMSVVFRIFSLSLRVIANMIAGHLLLDCLSVYVYSIAYNSFSYSSVSMFGLIQVLLLMSVITGLFCFEIFVCFLQAYIFVILAALYLVEILPVI